MRRALPLTLAVVAVTLVAVYFFNDPSHSSWFPRCVFYVTTGYRCPGCGSQRAIHALLHGQVWQAVRFNALFVVSLPLIAVLLAAEWHRALRGTSWLQRKLNTAAVAWGYAAVAVLWTILRNVFGF